MKVVHPTWGYPILSYPILSYHTVQSRKRDSNTKISTLRGPPSIRKPLFFSSSFFFIEEETRDRGKVALSLILCLC